MVDYRFFLIGLDGYLMGSTCIACPNDTEALTKGTEILATFYAAAEVWDGSRKVGRLEPGERISEGESSQSRRPKVSASRYRHRPPRCGCHPAIFPRLPGTIHLASHCALNEARPTARRLSRRGARR
jgi:hypothetical protein